MRQNLEFFAGAYGLTGARRREAIERVASAFDLEPHLSRLVRELPLGFKQRLALSCAIMHDPPVLFLDEPTSGVDPLARRQFWDLIAALSAAGTTVLVSTHYMEEAEYCHRLMLMNRGRLIAEGTPAELRALMTEPILEVETDDAPRAVEALAGAPGVLEAAMFGRAVHVVVRDEAEAWTVIPAVAAVAALVTRFVRSPIEVRPQIRLVVIAFAATMATILVFWALQPRLEEGLFDLVLATQRLEALHDLNLLILLTLSLLLVPIAVGISLVRYRLWDVELLVNRALVYGALTAMVAMVFVVGVVGLGSVLAGTVGGGRGVAGVITGVVLVLVFQPVRRRVQSTVDRRFYRQKYDAERAVDRFTREVGELVRPLSVAAAVGSLIRQTVQPTDCWVVLEPPEGPAVLGPVERADAPNSASWPTGASLMVPLIAQGRPVGAIYLGDRRSGTPYTTLDRRLLERISVAAAPSVRVGQLVEDQERLAVERARLDGELAVARTIQRDLLPRALPEISGWRFAARYESSREVGGDYYDVIPLEDGRLGLLVADVSGKGVPASLVMASCRAVVRSIAATVEDPAELLRRVNARLSADMTPSMFVTCFYAVLDPVAATLSFANAGHPLPVMRTAGGDFEELRATGMPFGWMADAAYDTFTRQLGPGSMVVIASDGVIEARDRAGEFWGTGRFGAAVAAASGPEVVDEILSALRAHCAPATDLGDDVTLLAVVRD